MGATTVSRDDGLRYRLAVASRAVAAIGGGYGLSALWAAALALHLPGSRADAVITATLIAYVIYTLAAIWVFAVRSAWRAWGGLLAAAALPAVLLLVHHALERTP